MGATEIPQPLPVRATRLETRDPDAVAAVQPERGRSYHQVAPGAFRGTVVEQAFGLAALGQERWSCGMRVRCERPTGYTVFAVPRAAGGRANWNGTDLSPGALLRVDGPWQITTSGSFAFVAFAVDGAALEATAAQLAGGEPAPRRWGSSVQRHPEAGPIGERLRHLLRRLESAPPHPAVLAAASAHLLHLAAALDRAADARPERLPPRSQRRAVVRRVEEFLDAHPGALHSVPALCGVAGVSERTLEYAFREQLGMPLVRYLKIRRLNRVRRALLGAAPGDTSVTEMALRWGFNDLGRFAGEYRAFFGELPSHTLRGRLRYPHISAAVPPVC